LIDKLFINRSLIPEDIQKITKNQETFSEGMIHIDEMTKKMDTFSEDIINMLVQKLETDEVEHL
jgi:hypothetical protein